MGILKGKAMLGMCAAVMVFSAWQVSAEEVVRELRNVNGTIYYYENDKISSQTNGFVNVDGITVLVSNGKVMSEKEGYKQLK